MNLSSHLNAAAVGRKERKKMRWDKRVQIQSWTENVETWEEHKSRHFIIFKICSLKDLLLHKNRHRSCTNAYKQLQLHLCTHNAWSRNLQKDTGTLYVCFIVHSFKKNVLKIQQEHHDFSLILFLSTTLAELMWENKRKWLFLPFSGRWWLYLSSDRYLPSPAFSQTLIVILPLSAAMDFLEGDASLKHCVL